MPEVPDDDTLELWLLGDVYRLLTQGRDRRADGAHVLDDATGLPLYVSDLRSDRDALRGEALALQWLVQPRQWARVHMGLWAHAPETWSPEAADAVEVVAFKIGRVIRSLAARGYMDESPDLHGYGPMGPDQANGGWATAATFTPAGLEHARSRVRGTKYERGAVSCVHELPAEKRAGLPSWVASEYHAEATA